MSKLIQISVFQDSELFLLAWQEDMSYSSRDQKSNSVKVILPFSCLMLSISNPRAGLCTLCKYIVTQETLSCEQLQNIYQAHSTMSLLAMTIDEHMIIKITYRKGTVEFTTI